MSAKTNWSGNSLFRLFMSNSQQKYKRINFGNDDWPELWNWATLDSLHSHWGSSNPSFNNFFLLAQRFFNIVSSWWYRDTPSDLIKQLSRPQVLGNWSRSGFKCYLRRVEHICFWVIGNEFINQIIDPKWAKDSRRINLNI